MKQAQRWRPATFFALVAVVLTDVCVTDTAAWLPAVPDCHRPRGVGLGGALRLSQKPMSWWSGDGDAASVVVTVTTAMNADTRNANEGSVSISPSGSVSRRNLLFRSAMIPAITVAGWGSMISRPQAAAHAYTIDQVDPDENDTYAEAQNISGSGVPLRVLWVGSGALTPRSGAARSGVYKNLFLAGNEVTAMDLLKPTTSDLRAAKRYATEQGYKLRFEQGDATKLKFDDETFDAVVCSLFLCQDFDPEVVVSEIRRVLKPGGRFGFFEHVEDIDKVIVGKVFGEASIVRVEAYPEKQNILAGVVKKV